MIEILLDENLPRPLVAHFKAPLVVVSVHDLGWSELKNGELIRAMLDNGFQYLLTADKNLQNQQNLQKYPITLILLRLFDNRLKSIIPLVESIQNTIEVEVLTGAKLIEIELRKDI